jgi:peptidoglycan endopeptidase LytE
LPHNAASQYGLGVTVAKTDLVPGDLLFFACSGSGIDHVGIYSGNGSFIHSSSPRSGGVIYSSLNYGYYLNAYVGAKRIIR